jgi:hypothetical protein
MTVKTLANIYLEMEPHIKLAGSYTHQRKRLPLVIRACRLKPYDWVFGKWKSKLALHRHWVDEWGNSLLLVGSRLTKIIPYDLELDTTKIVGTDLYEYLPPSKLLKISKNIFILAGKDEDQYSDHFIVAFYGIDGFLRVRSCLHDQWNICPPVLLGIKTLYSIVDHIGEEGCKEVPAQETILYSCAKQQTWISDCEFGGEFVATMKQYAPTVLEYLS